MAAGLGKELMNIEKDLRLGGQSRGCPTDVFSLITYEYGSLQKAGRLITKARRCSLEVLLYRPSNHLNRQRGRVFQPYLQLEDGTQIFGRSGT